MLSPHIPNNMQNHHQQQQQVLHLHVHGVFRCSHCSSLNHICHYCSSYSSIFNLRYDCINCGKPSWTTPTGRQRQNSTTGNNTSRNRRLTFSAVCVSSFSTAAPPPSSSSSSSSSSPAAAGGNSSPFSSMVRVVGPTLSNWVPQPSMLRPVVQIPRPPTLPQQQIPNINVQVFPRPPALPQQQNPNIGITMAKKPALNLELSLKPPERPSGTPQQRPQPFDLNMAPPDN